MARGVKPPTTYMLYFQLDKAESPAARVPRLEQQLLSGRALNYYVQQNKTMEIFNMVITTRKKSQNCYNLEILS